MTDEQHPAQFDWATELSDAQGHVTLSEQEAHEIGARLRRQHARIAELEAQLSSPGCDHGPQATSIEEAARDVGKWLNERPNRPIDLRHVAMLCAHAQAAQGAQEPVAWYVTGCGRLLDEDEAKAEARHIGGTARAIPLYTAPQADSQPAVDALAEAEYFIDNPSAWSNFDQRASDAIAAVCKAFRAARAQADSVLGDAARYRWLRERMLGIDFDWNESGITALSFEMPDGCAYGGCCNQNIDAARAAQEGKSHG